MLDLLELLAAIGELWVLRRLIAFVTACAFGYYAYAFFVDFLAPGAFLSDLLSATACLVGSIFFIVLTFRRRKE